MLTHKINDEIIYGKEINDMLAAADLGTLKVMSFGTPTQAKNYFAEHDPSLLIIFGAKACSQAGIKKGDKQIGRGVDEIEHKGKYVPTVVRAAVVIPNIPNVSESIRKDINKDTQKFNKNSQTHRTFENLREGFNYIKFIETEWR